MVHTLHCVRDKEKVCAQGKTSWNWARKRYFKGLRTGNFHHVCHLCQVANRGQTKVDAKREKSKCSGWKDHWGERERSCAFTPVAWGSFFKGRGSSFQTILKRHRHGMRSLHTPKGLAGQLPVFSTKGLARKRHKEMKPRGRDICSWLHG